MTIIHYYNPSYCEVLGLAPKVRYKLSFCCVGQHYAYNAYLIITRCIPDVAGCCKTRISNMEPVGVSQIFIKGTLGLSQIFIKGTVGGVRNIY